MQRIGEITEVLCWAVNVTLLFQSSHKAERSNQGAVRDTKVLPLGHEARSATYEMSLRVRRPVHTNQNGWM